MNTHTHLLKPASSSSAVFPTGQWGPSVRNAGRRIQVVSTGAQFHSSFFPFTQLAGSRQRGKGRKAGLSQFLSHLLPKKMTSSRKSQPKEASITCPWLLCKYLRRGRKKPQLFLRLFKFVVTKEAVGGKKDNNPTPVDLRYPEWDTTSGGLETGGEVLQSGTIYTGCASCLF